MPRVCAGRDGPAAYPRDLTDAQWQVIALHLPAERPGGEANRRASPGAGSSRRSCPWDRTGCAWRHLPANFPPRQTLYGRFAAGHDDGTLARHHSQLRAHVQAVIGRASQPTAAHPLGRQGTVAATGFRRE